MTAAVSFARSHSTIHILLVFPRVFLGFLLVCASVLHMWQQCVQSATCNVQHATRDIGCDNAAKAMSTKAASEKMPNCRRAGDRSFDTSPESRVWKVGEALVRGSSRARGLFLAKSRPDADRLYLASRL